MENNGFIPLHEFNERCQLAWTRTFMLLLSRFETSFTSGWGGYVAAYAWAKRGQAPGAEWIAQFTAELLKG